MFGNLGFGEIVGILVICLLLFGSKRLPEIGSSFGKGIREFKRSLSEAGEAVTGNDTPSTPPSRQLDQRSGPTPPSGGEPKRLSQ
ncbi:MAG TPA: twin-arginine translocase TatA/TatE family subunit [Gemmatimonadales bacterium]|nr:twin-arginine translocase TatA/TatE family subunit [Gemmatimonadales bacterium]